MTRNCEFLVIGTGVAGLSFALKVASLGKVLLVAKSKTQSTNTNMAQGGIASVQAVEDNFESHVKDTLVAGAGLCNPEVVHRIVEDAPERIRDLMNWGVVFDKKDAALASEVALTQEGGHSHRRILHVQDHTGQAIQQALTAKVEAHPNIEILEDHMAMELMMDGDRCVGAYFLDIHDHKILKVFAPITMLGTGGAGKVYLYTSNWDGATGDGIAMALRAGCRAANMEFVQFHPTCLYHRESRNFLISEALRGEGAELINSTGHKFAYDYDPKGPMAPRDIVARAIDAEMKSTGDSCVFLDIRHKGEDFLQKRFPVIFERCLSFGFNLAKEPLPVVPAAHYLCGGIWTDANGETDKKGLFAIGECAYTGLHGANRLASNSLLECLAFSHYASSHIRDQKLHQVQTPEPALTTPWKLETKSRDEMILITHLWNEIRTCMWNYVGIVRSDRRLVRAKARLALISQEIDEYYQRFQLHPDIIELRNLATVASISIDSALERTHSVGTHYNIDHPEPPGPEEDLYTAFTLKDFSK